MKKLLTVVFLMLVPVICLAESQETRLFQNGVASASTGDFKKAKEEFSAALKINPKNRFAKESMGIINDFEKGKKQKGFALAHFKGLNYLFTGEFDKALPEFEAALKNDPKSALANNSVGVGYLYTMNKEKDAEKFFKKAIELNKKYVDAYINLAFYYNNYAPDAQKAKDYALTALKIEPDVTGAFVELGDADLALGKLEEAVENYKKALSQEKDNVLALRGLGLANFRLGKVDDAIEAHQNLLKLIPEHLDSYMALGEIYLSQGDIEKAEVNFKKAKVLAEKYDDLQKAGIVDQYLRVIKTEKKERKQ